MSSDGRDGDIDARFDDIMSHWDDPYAEPEASTEGGLDSGPADDIDGTAGTEGADGTDGTDGTDGPGSSVGKSINPAPHYRIIRLPEASDQTAGDRADQPGATTDREDTGDAGGRGDGGLGAREPGDPATGDRVGSTPATGAGSADSVWRSHPDVEDDDHFVPPPPAPLPAGDLQFWGILIGLTGGPGLLLYLIMFDRYASSLWIALAIALSLGGFGLLVARLPSHRDEDDGDDGARV